VFPFILYVISPGNESFFNCCEVCFLTVVRYAFITIERYALKGSKLNLYDNDFMHIL
jgi:hypothetical protein